MGNLDLWKAVERTDPSQTKSFSGKGGFKGTAISPMWLIKRATEQWGPIGGKWGVRILKEHVVEGAPLMSQAGGVVGSESIHIVQAEVYYPLPDGTQGTVPCFGQTQLVGANKYGFYTDEEAPKKSLTDAITKGLSWLGFAADVHMGRFDDSKYVNQVAAEIEREKASAAESGTREKGLKILQPAAEQGLAALELAWKSISQDMRKACQPDLADLKAKAAKAKPSDGKDVA